LNVQDAAYIYHRALKREKGVTGYSPIADKMQNVGVRHVSSLQSGIECSVVLQLMVTVVTLGLLSPSSISRKQLSQVLHPQEEATSVEAV
jgi:hypothetical protein